MNNISRSIKLLGLYLLFVVSVICVLIIFAEQVSFEKRKTSENEAIRQSVNIEAASSILVSNFTNTLNDENLILTGDMLYPDSHEIAELMNYSGGLMGYYVSEFFVADLNTDGEYEIYTNSHAGSGIVHDFIECYDSKSQKYSILENRMKINYCILQYNEELYIRADDHMLSSFYEPHVYKLIIVNGELNYEKIDEQLESVILKVKKNPGLE